MSESEDQPPAEEEAAPEKRPALSLRRNEAPAESGPSYQNDEGPTPQGDKPKDEKKEEKPPSAVRTALRILVAIVVIGAGFRFGFGPLISHARGKMTTVIVKNRGDEGYSLRLGWRMLTGRLIPQGQEQFELAVSWYEHQGLRLQPLDANGQPSGAARKLSVPMHPGGVTLVNLDQAGTYYTYDTQSIASESITGLDPLLSQITKGEPPAAMQEVLTSAHALGEKAFIEKRNDLFFELTEFRPTPTVGYFAKAVDTEAEPDPSLPVLTDKEHDLDVANGRIKHYAADTTLLEATLPSQQDLPMNLGSQSFVIPKGTRVVVVDSKDKAGPVKQVRLQFGNQTIDMKGKTYSGSWSYAAILRGSNWSWVWTFNGQTQDRKSRITVTLDHLGKSNATETTTQ